MKEKKQNKLNFILKISMMFALLSIGILYGKSKKEKFSASENSIAQTKH